MPPLLKAQNLTKYYPGTTALHGNYCCFYVDHAGPGNLAA
jgi:hypothetical protein